MLNVCDVELNDDKPSKGRAPLGLRAPCARSRHKVCNSGARHETGQFLPHASRLARTAKSTFHIWLLVVFW